MKANDVVLGSSVDLLASINAKIKSLQDQANVLKEVLIASNQASIEGDLFKAAIKFVEPSPSIDYKKVVELMEIDIPKAVLKKASKVRAPYYSVSLYDL